MPQVVVVGLGPAGPELVTCQTRELLESEQNIWLRTVRHPAAVLVPDASSFDHIYDSADRIEDVYRSIVDELVKEADAKGRVVYAVPGSPLVAETSVDLLRKDPRVDIEIIPSMSFLDLAWSRLQIDPLSVSPRLVDGHVFATEAAGERGPLFVAQCDADWVLSDIKLSFEQNEPESVIVLQRLGLPDEAVFTIPWEDLDRVVKPDHLTSIWIPQIPAPVGFELARVQSVATRLRRDCPWDQEQTHDSLARYLIEESYELIEAIEETEDDDTDLIEELGDLLFQVFAHSAIAEEEGRFNIADVAQVVADKLIERHPHVYGDVVAETSSDVMATWEANKKASKGRESLMDGIPRHLPALLYGWKVLRKARTAGITVSPDDITSHDLGGRLLLVILEAIAGSDDPESELRTAVTSLKFRFQKAESLASADGIELASTDSETSMRYWNLARTHSVD